MNDAIEDIECEVKSFFNDGTDWYKIERVNHDGRRWHQPMKYGLHGIQLMTSARLSPEADIEGTAAEMQAIALAIGEHSTFWTDRCAVKCEGEVVEIWSPKNSEEPFRISYARAQALATQIHSFFIKNPPG